MKTSLPISVKSLRSTGSIRIGLAMMGLVAGAALPVANADVSGPYTADADTTFLLHFNESAGTSSAANSGTVGGNALSYNNNTYPGGTGGTTPGVATLATNILGATAYSGFGTAANVNPGTATQNTANGNGLGFDFNNSGAFNISRTATASADYLPLSGNIFNSTTKAFTLEAMIQISTPTVTAGGQEIMSTDSANANAGRGFQFRLTANGALEFNAIGGPTVTSFDAISTIPVTDASLGANAFNATDWFHAAVTYDGTNVSFYWTKVDPANTSASLLGAALPFASANLDLTDFGPLVFGNEGRFATGGTFSNDGLLGFIDEARISTIARTADQFIFAVPEPGATGLVVVAGLAFLVILRPRRRFAL